MGQITTKFSYGDDVCCGHVRGRVTGITTRQNFITYEFSYVDSDGNPTCRNVAECELLLIKESKMGFGK